MDDATQVHKRLHAIFRSKLNLEIPSIDADLVESGLLDSLTFVELLLNIEQEFGRKISMDDLEIKNFRSIARIAEFVMNQDGFKK